jgi:hypothetical protein
MFPVQKVSAKQVAPKASETPTSQLPRPSHNGMDGILLLSTDVSLPGSGTSALDQQALDPTNGHLFIAHPGEGQAFSISLDNVVFTVVLSEMEIPP